jgi:hypothetical protein
MTAGHGRSGPRERPCTRRRLAWRLALLAVAGGAMLLAAVPAAADGIPGPVPVTLGAAGGSACPQGVGTSAAMSSDFSAMTFTLTQNVLGSYRFCQFTLKLGVPDGWQYGVAPLEAHGSASIPLGAIGTLKDSVSIPGAVAPPPATTLLVGPWNQPYDFAFDAVPMWSDCSASGDLLNVKFQWYVPGGAQIDPPGSVTTRKAAVQYRACVTSATATRSTGARRAHSRRGARRTRH